MRGHAGWRSRRRRALWPVVAVTLALGAAACDPGEPTDPETTTSESGEVTTEPSTEPSTDASTEVPMPPELDQPDIPDEAGVDDRSGAAAFVEYYFALLDYARATGDTRELEARSGGSCKTCETAIEYIDSVHGAGGWIETLGGSRVTEIVVAFPEADDPNYYVGFHYVVDGFVEHEADGTTTSVDAADRPSAAMLVAWTDSGFVANGLDLEADG